MIEQKIKLPYAGSDVYFTLEALIKYFNSKKTNFIIIGASHVKLENHTKKDARCMV